MTETRGLWRGQPLRESYFINGFLSEYNKRDNTATLYDPIRLEIYVVKPETLGECTGLRDKNKKLIFEGDILRIPDCYLPVVVHWSPTCARFFVDDISDDFLIMDFSDVVNGEIIGNIHDNPELLERR